MWCDGISAYCEDDKDTKSDGGKERCCSLLEPARPVSSHAGIVAWHGLEISVEGLQQRPHFLNKFAFCGRECDFDLSLPALSVT
jgi:hypothetical protein